MCVHSFKSLGKVHTKRESQESKTVDCVCCCCCVVLLVIVVPDYDFISLIINLIVFLENIYPDRAVIQIFEVSESYIRLNLTSISNIIYRDRFNIMLVTKRARCDQL